MKIRGLLIASLAALAAISSADTFLVPVTFTLAPSVDGLYDPDNTDVSFDMTAVLPGYQNFSITGIQWDDIVIETIGNSWLSDVVISFEATSAETTVANFYDSNPGTGDDASGTGSYSSGGLLPASVDLDPDNMLRIHIWEIFDDVAGAADATVVSGIYTLQFEATPVPEPATLVALGIGAAALVRRRKKK
ncbi:MAG: PEP-CTERM sorting domain-containing protein [Chlorobia bacterium]|nr:PEP-CTERM sorting domain-containing protein [Fimbriimonadaceae bacterium]